MLSILSFWHLDVKLRFRVVLKFGFSTVGLVESVKKIACIEEFLDNKRGSICILRGVWLIRKWRKNYKILAMIFFFPTKKSYDFFFTLH